MRADTSIAIASPHARELDHLQIFEFRLRLGSNRECSSMLGSVSIGQRPSHVQTFDSRVKSQE